MAASPFDFSVGAYIYLPLFIGLILALYCRRSGEAFVGHWVGFSLLSAIAIAVLTLLTRLPAIQVALGLSALAILPGVFRLIPPPPPDTTVQDELSQRRALAAPFFPLFTYVRLVLIKYPADLLPAEQQEEHDLLVEALSRTLDPDSPPSLDILKTREFTPETFDPFTQDAIKELTNFIAIASDMPFINPTDAQCREAAAGLHAKFDDALHTQLADHNHLVIGYPSPSPFPTEAQRAKEDIEFEYAQEVEDWCKEEDRHRREYDREEKRLHQQRMRDAERRSMGREAPARDDLPPYISLPFPKKPQIPVAIQDALMLEQYPLPLPLSLTPEERTQHTYMIGRTGSGKTTLLKFLIAQDLTNNHQGVIVISPESGIFDALLPLIPDHRKDDLIYIDPSDLQDPIIGFNPLETEEGTPPYQKAGETFTILERALTQDADLGVRMLPFLNNAVRALIARPHSTIYDLEKLFDPADPTLRLQIADDPRIDARIRTFWRDCDTRSSNRATFDALRYRLDVLLNPPLSVILTTGSFSFHEAINDHPHIMFCNLSHLRGMESPIFAQLLLAEIQLTLFRRDHMPQSSYIPYALYMDEFQTYADTSETSLIEMLNKARKYRLSITLANQVIANIPQKLLDSITGNVGTLIAMSLAAQDAAFFARDLQLKDHEGHTRPDLLQNLPRGHAFVRTPPHPHAVPITIPALPRAERNLDPGYPAVLKTLSKERYGKNQGQTPSAPLPALTGDPDAPYGALLPDMEPESPPIPTIDRTRGVPRKRRG